MWKDTKIPINFFIFNDLVLCLPLSCLARFVWFNVRVSTKTPVLRSSFYYVPNKSACYSTTINALSISILLVFEHFDYRFFPFFRGSSFEMLSILKHGFISYRIFVWCWYCHTYGMLFIFGSAAHFFVLSGMNCRSSLGTYRVKCEKCPNKCFPLIPVELNHGRTEWETNLVAFSMNMYTTDTTNG